MFRKPRFHRLFLLPALAAYIVQTVAACAEWRNNGCVLVSIDRVISESGDSLEAAFCCCSSEDCCCCSESDAEERPACGCSHQNPVPDRSHTPTRSDDIRIRLLSAGGPDIVIPAAVSVGARCSVPCGRPVCVPDRAAHILHCVWTT